MIGPGEAHSVCIEVSVSSLFHRGRETQSINRHHRHVHAAVIRNNPEDRRKGNVEEKRIIEDKSVPTSAFVHVVLADDTHSLRAGLQFPTRGTTWRY